MIGRVTSVFGVKGWLKVFSYTDPREGILQYRDWTLVFDKRRLPVTMLEGRRQGPGVVVRLKGVDDRDLALGYCGADIVVPTSSLPPLADGEYYWHQLESLRVETSDGECFGAVQHMIETGANDVMVVQATADSMDQRERLIPWLPDQVVLGVDLERGVIVVNWDPEF